jgi:hypothetical protein
MVMAGKSSGRKAQKQYERYTKNAHKIHARHCSDPGWCTYDDPESPATADDAALPWPERQERAALRLDEYRNCPAAVDAENAAAEIERHHAAVRKIVARGRPLKGPEAYRIYPE